MLTIELVPSTVWYKNLRSELTTAQWDHVRKAAYRAAGYVCEICSEKGPKWPVECHEIWDFNDETHTQTLTGLIALCPSCHEVKHIGLAGKRGRGESARSHLARVNGWTNDQADEYIEEAFLLWSNRSLDEWTLDISWIQEHLP
jgi:5-methylcytosine-specific restriction endonuclease McrA